MTVRKPFEAHTLSTADVAQLMGWSQSNVRRLVASGQLPHIKVHKRYRFNREDVLNWALAADL